MNKQTQQQPGTIAALAISVMRAYEKGEADLVVAAVKRKFPGSKFDRGQYHYYHSLLDRGMIDSAGKRKPS